MAVPSRPTLLSKLDDVFNGLTEVKVVTILAKPVVTVDQSDNRTKTDFKAPTGELDAFVSVFNLIDGDATNIASEDLLANETLRQLHLAQVDKSLAVLPQNIEALVRLGKAIIDELRRSDDG